MFKALDSVEVEWTLEQREVSKKELPNQWRNLNKPTNSLIGYLSNAKSMVDPS